MRNFRAQQKVNMQKYFRIWDYIYEFWDEIYEVYSKHATAFLCTYYRLDTDVTIWDSTALMGGPYEWVGSLSGVRWRKITLLPVYFITETSTEFEGTEAGVTNAGDFNFVIPSAYGFIPNFGDIIKLDEKELVDNDRDDLFPIYIVSGIKKQSSSDKTYYMLHCDVYQSRTTTDVDRQVSTVETFYDYDKKIHTLDDAITLTRMLERSSMIRNVLKNMYDQNSGYYLV